MAAWVHGGGVRRPRGVRQAVSCLWCHALVCSILIHVLRVVWTYDVVLLQHLLIMLIGTYELQCVQLGELVLQDTDPTDRKPQECSGCGGCPLHLVSFNLFVEFQNY